jgi:putative methylase
MRKKQLEIKLQGLEQLASPIPALEQYATPAIIAADMIWEAYGAGDIAGKAVADLGCGNGILGIGAKLLDAGKVLGMDVDPMAIRVAEKNAASLSLDIDFLEGDVRKAEGTFDTVLMNPPFGAQKRRADRPFVEKALELAPRAYSLHNAGTEDFLDKLAMSLGARTVSLKKYKFEIPFAFEFHRKATEAISVVLLRYDR